MALKNSKCPEFMEVEISRTPMHKNQFIVVFGSLVWNTCPKISLSLHKGDDKDLIPGIPSQNHKIAESLHDLGWKVPLQAILSMPLAEGRPPLPCPGDFWVSPRMELLGPLVLCVVHKCPCPDHLITYLLLLVIVWMWECKGMHWEKDCEWVKPMYFRDFVKWYHLLLP